MIFLKIELILRTLLYVLVSTLLVCDALLLNKYKEYALEVLSSMGISESIINTIIFYTVILTICIVLLISNTYGLIKCIVKAKKNSI